MRNIATCYNEQAIHVSDSYCSTPSKLSYISPNYTPSTQRTIKCNYKITHPPRKPLFITLTWSTFAQKALTISINRNSFDISTLIGSKKFESRNSRIEVIWDISCAKYERGPQPIKGFFIDLFINSELCFSLGDEEKSNKTICVSNCCSLLTRHEYFFGGDLYSTNVKFFESGTCHDVLIKGVVENKGTLGVWIDGKNVVEVKRLKWNFRGNQGVFIDGLLVDFMWDVYDWFFGDISKSKSNSNSNSGCGIFLFRPRSGLDCRLWLEEKEQERFGISLMICACKNS